MDGSVEWMGPQVVDALHPFIFAVKAWVLACFGTSLILSACQIARSSLRSIRAWVESTRLLFLCGSGALISHFILAQVASAVFPYAQPTASSVLLGVSVILAFGTLVVDRVRPQEAVAPLFLASAGIWLLCLFAPLPSGHSQASVLADQQRSVVSVVHIATAIVGEGLCLVALFCAVLYLWGLTNLRSGRWERVAHMPSLDKIEHVQTLSTTIGLVFMTTSLVTGFLVASHQGGLLAVGLVKLAWAMGAWIWYVLILFGREMWGWKGKKGAKLSVIGGLILIVTLFGTFL